MPFVHTLEACKVFREALSTTADMRHTNVLTAIAADERCILEMGDDVDICLRMWESLCPPSTNAICTRVDHFQQRLPQKITIRNFVHQFPMKLPVSVFHVKHVLPSVATTFAGMIRLVEGIHPDQAAAKYYEHVCLQVVPRRLGGEPTEPAGRLHEGQRLCGGTGYHLSTQLLNKLKCS